MWTTDANASWLDLEDKVAPEVFLAPKTSARANAGQEWPPVPRRIVQYLIRNVAGSLWMNHLTLISLVLMAQRRDAATVLGIVCQLHVRFKSLFSELGLTEVAQWDPKQYIPAYLKGELVARDSDWTRTIFWFSRRLAAAKCGILKNQIHSSSKTFS